LAGEKVERRLAAVLAANVAGFGSDIGLGTSSTTLAS
jgi:hypothetical protein